MEYFELNNGVKVPKLGFGTYQMPNSITEKNVTKALDLGYRNIDTAQNYGNEKEVGAAINKSSISRDQIFVTSKVQTSGYDDTKRGIDKSLHTAQLDYFDLMIIHWPTIHDEETYHALEAAYKAGKVRAIGLSNFNSQQTQAIINQSDVIPAVNQIETHIYWQQKKMHTYLNEQHILHEAWAPLGEGRTNMLQDPLLKNIAANHQKSVAQTILRFLTQEDIMVIPKSTNPEHIATNLDIFDFQLNANEINEIRNLDHKASTTYWPSSMQGEANY